jgi:MFS family permease
LTHQTEPAPFRTLPGGLAPFGYRDYLLYWIGFATSNTGRWIELTGALWLVYELTESPALLGLVGLARAAPAFALSPIAGVVADRVDQRRLLFVTQVASLALSLGLGLLVLSGQAEVWHLYAQLALQAAIQPFDAAARQTLFPRLVPRASLARAVTLTVMAGRSAKFIGPALGGIAISQLGVASPYLLNAASFLVLMVAVVAMRPLVAIAARSGSSFAGELVEGFRHIRSAPVLSGILMLEVVFGLLQMNEVMITLIARDFLHVGPEGLGLLLAAPALGALAGIGTLIVVGPAKRPGRFVVTVVVVYVGVLLVVAGSPFFGLTFLALGCTGYLDSVITVTRHSILQLAAPAEMRGRVMANMGTITNGIGPLAQVQSGALVGVLGVPLAIAVSSGALLVATLVTARANAAMWAFRFGDHGTEADRRPSQPPIPDPERQPGP